MALVISGLVFVSVWWSWTDSLNKLFYDQLMQLRTKDPPADVIVIAIDEYSLGHIGEWPWSRRHHGKLIDHLNEAGVRAIGYDVVFAELNPLDPDGDEAFAAAIVRSGKVVLPVYIDRTQLGGQLIEVLPHPLFAEHAKMGHVNTELDEDGIVRRFYQFEGIGDAYWSHFATVVAELSVGYVQPQVPSLGSNAVSPLINVRRLPRLIPFLGGVGSFQQVSFYDVISGKVPKRLFKDRIVFVGATSISLGDLLPTPVTVQGEQMPGVEINATVFEAARSDQFIKVMHKAWRAAFSVLLVLAAILLIPRIAGKTTLLAIVASTFIILLLQTLLLLRFDYWVPLASALIGQWLVYPLWTVLRLDQTLRYLQKQLLMLQEELSHQTLVEHHADTDKVMMEKISLLMEVVDVDDFLLLTSSKILHQWSDQAAAIELKSQLSELSDGPQRTPDLFYCKYQQGIKIYLLAISIYEQKNWNELKEAYVVGFFENACAPGDSDYIGTYDLVFKYLNEVRKSQNEVNNARFLFEYCVNEMNDGVIIADEFGAVLFVNRLALHHLALNNASQFGLLDLMLNLQLKDSEQLWSSIVFNLVSEREPQEVEVITHHGSVLLVNLSYLDVVAQRANLIVINLYDITRMREAQRLRNETIDFLSHDMRSPMVSLLALVNQKRLAGLPEDFLCQIEQYATKNLYFAEQFLQLARVESNESIQFYEVDFEAIVQNAIDDVYSQAQQQGMELNFVVDDSLFWVRGNGELLERAVVNLITNAIKYGPDNTTVDIELRAHGANLLFGVRDVGPGIPKEQQAYLFAPFQRINNKINHKEKHKQKGAGLGLRFVDVTIKRHGGEIYFSSQPGHTEFGFTLPVIDVES
ncbi:MAG: CHASE2 and HATPase_c domain-containing protein [Pseudomonadales bacterium]|nr:CHASE2 and HATPase_c domain-containing protein [Pseudomonadales bacterium]